MEKKLFVVIDTDKARVTDLGDETSEVWNKETNEKAIYSNSVIYAELVAIKERAPIGSYKHKNH